MVTGVIIPHYWAKAEQKIFEGSNKEYLAKIWRSSDDSQNDAQWKATEALKNLVSRIENEETIDHYAYHDKPVREEIIKEMPAAS